MLQVGTHYGARRWSSEPQAKKAWEHAVKDVMGCSVWRTAAPTRPPHRDHIVIVMGEDQTIVNRRLAILASYGGDEWPLDEELVKALRARRLNAALDSGNAPFKKRGMNAKLDRQGRFRRA